MSRLTIKPENDQGPKIRKPTQGYNVLAPFTTTTKQKTKKRQGLSEDSKRDDTKKINEEENTKSNSGHMWAYPKVKKKKEE